MSRVAPIVPAIVGKNGAYRAVRSSSAQGSCGVHGYPCEHPGTDLVGRAGTVVRSPEAGIVINAADGSAAPFSGYGPWLVIIQGVSGKYHLLAHLDPSAMLMAPIGLKVEAGTPIGKTSSANHTHWEVRSKPVPAFSKGETNFTNNVDGMTWLNGGSVLIAVLVAGGAGVLYWLWKRR